MEVHLTLQLIANVLMIIGAALLAPNAIHAHTNKTTNRFQLVSAWIGLLVGLIFNNVAFYTQQFAMVYSLVGYLIILYSALIALPGFFGNHGRKSQPAFAMHSLGWIGVVLSLVLIIVGIHFSSTTAIVLKSIAYPLLLVSIILFMKKMFHDHQSYNILSWIFFFVSMIVMLVGIYA